MPSTYDVTAVCKAETSNAFEAVTHLCGEGYAGATWKIPLADAIEGVRCGRFEFLVADDTGHKQKLVIARSPYNRYYLRAEGDRSEPKGLLMLPNQS